MTPLPIEQLEYIRSRMAVEFDSSRREGSYVSANYIRNKSSESNVSDNYALYPEADTNNTPATRVFVRSNPDGAFEINGKTAPRLLLTRGKKYQFNVVTSAPFGMFDTNGIALTPMSKYTVFGFQSDSQTPTEFFYGSNVSRGHRGSVKLV